MGVQVAGVRLRYFKGFVDSTVSLSGTSVLVGANNAGKSTIVSALRLVAAMIPRMRQVRPNQVGVIDGELRRGWGVTQVAIDSAAFNPENVRWDFRGREARIDVRFTDHSSITITWPGEEFDDDHGISAAAYAFGPKGVPFDRRLGESWSVPVIGIVPTLMPIDDREVYVQSETLRTNLTSRRASRFFRNALLRLKEDGSWQEFVDYVVGLTPEVRDLSIAVRDDNSLDLYYVDRDTNHEREITWAGDGIQIWIQVLFHFWRQREVGCLVLDEPDVYLHPDLQRRVAQLVFSSEKQTIVATHSTEILSEAEEGAAVWIDRGRDRSERPRSTGALSDLGRRLGSGLELGVAKALRSKAVLFVEGDESQLLFPLAAAVGCRNVVPGADLSVLSLGGFSRRWVSAGFAEVMEALGGGVSVFVLLDGDLKSDECRKSELADLQRPTVSTLMLTRRDIENYLIDAERIAAATGMDAGEVEALLDDAYAELADGARQDLVAQRFVERSMRDSSLAGVAPNTLIRRTEVEFDQIWSTRRGQMSIVDAKELRHYFNRNRPRAARPMKWKQCAGIADAQLDLELRRFLQELDDALTVDRRA